MAWAMRATGWLAPNTLEDKRTPALWASLPLPVVALLGLWRAGHADSR